MRLILLTGWLLSLGLGLSSRASAAPATEALSAVGTPTGLPELRLSVGYEHSAFRGIISREFVDDGSLRDIRELDFRRDTKILNLKLRVGLFRHLEGLIFVPVVLGEDTTIDFSSGVAGSSTIFGSSNADDPADPTGLSFPITDIPQSRERAGVGDLGLGLKWTALREEVDGSFPSTALSALIRLPTGKLRDPTDQAALPGGEDSGGVGLGVTAFDLSVAFSKRAQKTAPSIDTYLELGAELPIAMGRAKDLGLQPPLSGRFELGAEVLVAADPKRSTRYGFGVSFQTKYIGPGRTYGVLADFLPNFDQTRLTPSESNPDPIASYSNFADANNYARSVPGTRCGSVTGIPCGEVHRVDEHLRLSGRVEAFVKPFQWGLFKLGAEVAWLSEHFLTTEPAGEDADPAGAFETGCPSEVCAGRVNATNTQGVDERSPYYDPRYDAPGRRLRLERAYAITVFGALVATF